MTWTRRHWLAIAALAAITVSAIGLILESAGVPHAGLVAIAITFGPLYLYACLCRSPIVALVILITAGFDNTLRNLFQPFSWSTWFTVLDDAVLAIAIGCTLVHLCLELSRTASTTGIANHVRVIARRLQTPWITLTAVGLLAYVLAGVCGFLISRSHPDGFLLGTWLSLKLIATIFVITRLNWTRRAIAYTVNGVIIILGIQTAAVLAEFLFPEFVQGIFRVSREASRSSFATLKGVFNHPVQSATFGLFAMATLTLGPNERWKQIVGYAAGTVALSGLRVKTLIDIVVVIALRLFVGGSKRARIIAPIIVAAASTLLIVFAHGIISQRVNAVLFSDDSRRKLLLDAGFAIARDGVVVGTGFGSFGSEASRSPYSSVWVDYGLSEEYGFTNASPMFATDLSWATLLGETGFLGTAGLVLAAATLCTYLVRRSWTRRTSTWHLAALGFAAVIVIDSFASPRLFDGFAAAGLAILLAFALVDDRQPREDSVVSLADLGPRRGHRQGIRPVDGTSWQEGRS